MKKPNPFAANAAKPFGKAGPMKTCPGCKSGAKCKAAGKCLAKGK